MSPQGGRICYPAPEAAHEEVIADASLFHRTLEHLLTHIGVKLKIPKVGGVEVDLHMLYKQVTHMGGLDLVISRKQWVIVCEPFHFPSSFTNKSFVIKKLYVNALHHYEQLYFHRRTGPLVPAPSGPGSDTLSGSTASPSGIATGDVRSGKRRPGEADHMLASGSAVSDSVAVVATGSSLPVPPGLKDGTKFTGTIDACFDAGYAITLNVAGHRLQGMLYRDAAAPNTGLAPSSGRGRVAHSQELDSSVHDTAKRARLAQPAAAPAPVRPVRTPFQFFQLGVRKGDLLQHAKDGDPANKESLPRIISDLWNQMGWEQRKPFEDLAAKDRVRFERDWAEWHARHGNASGSGSGHVREGIDAEAMTPPGAAVAGASSSVVAHGLEQHGGGGASPAHVLHHSFSHQVQLSSIGDAPHHRLSKSASMPPPADVPDIMSAPGFHLLPNDLQPDDLDHLRHFGDVSAKDAAAAGLPSGFGADAGTHRPVSVPFDEQDLSAADFGEHTDAYALAMDVLGHEVDAEASAMAGGAADIDMFGCHTTVQVSSGSKGNVPSAKGVSTRMGMPDVCTLPTAVGPSTAPHRSTAPVPKGAAMGNDGTLSSAGTPSDDHMTQMFHGMLQYEAAAAADELHLPS